MSLVARWQARAPLCLEELFAVTRPVLVEAAIGLLRLEFAGFDDAAADKLRADELGQHLATGRIRLPAKSNSQRDQPWADGCAIVFQTFDPSAAREVLQHHDQFRLYRVAERATPAPSGRSANEHTWEVAAKVEWTGGREPCRVESAYVGLLGTTPQSAHRDGQVHRVLRRIRLNADGISPAGVRYVDQPRRYLAGDGLNYSIGWQMRSEAFVTDEDLVAALTAVGRAAWHGLTRARATPPDPE